MKLVRHLSCRTQLTARLRFPFTLFNCPLTTRFVNFFSPVELLEFSEDRHPWESVEEKLNAIRCESLAVCLIF